MRVEVDTDKMGASIKGGFQAGLDGLGKFFKETKETVSAKLFEECACCERTRSDLTREIPLHGRICQECSDNILTIFQFNHSDAFKAAFEDAGKRSRGE